MPDGMKFTMKARIEFFPQRIVDIANQPSGVVSAQLKQTAEAVLNAAKPLIGNKYAGHHPENGPLREAGRVEQGSGSSWSVVFSHPAAFIHHNGARAHGISPGNPKGMGRKGSGIVTSWGATKFWTRSPVSHPGSPANPFLIDAARSLGLSPTEGGTRFGRFRGEGGKFAPFRRSI